ncbi:hypothetical protein ACWC9T_27435 [Kitasatospora sp. NPDC001159]
MAGVEVPADHQTAYNLTVDQLHTYYELAGATPVLVHNCDTATVHELSMTKPGRGTRGAFCAASESFG